VHVDTNCSQTFRDAIGDPTARFASVLSYDGLGFGYVAEEVMAEGTSNEKSALRS